MPQPSSTLRPQAVAPSDPTTERANPPARPEPEGLIADAIARHADDPDFVTALARGMAVMLALSETKRRMSIAQISHRTGIPRAAARRSLHTLVKMGFVAADDARRYYLRPRVLSFSHGYLSGSPLAVLAQPILDRLGDSLRESCSLGTLDGDEIVYLSRSTSSRIMSTTLNVGRRLPAYCTSIGHVLLAHLPQDELDDYLARVRFYPYTEHTPNSKESLLPMLQAVRDSGFAFASQLMEPRLCTLAVPVRDTGGHYVAGINVILQGRLHGRAEMAERYFRPLHDAAMELGSLLLP
jgi:IclR family transcriptional regulator, pca regulon regulatory protein